ncbi:MAG: DUF2933 domain-containing protein [Burkholderiaceae bacterium]|nr:DUF2933 domain-containing protein [Burkholderiaceae bacterium]
MPSRRFTTSVGVFMAFAAIAAFFFVAEHRAHTFGLLPHLLLLSCLVLLYLSSRGEPTQDSNGHAPNA